MRKFIIFHYCCLLAGIVTFYSCKKNGEEAQIMDASKAETATKLTAWLDKQKSVTATLYKKTKIQNLKENLELSELWLEDFTATEKFVVVPLKKEFVSANNVGKNPISYLVLVLADNDSITKGNVIQYVSTTGGKKQVPQNTFSKLFTHTVFDCDGQFTVVSITDYLRYELKFAGGKLTSVAEPRRKTAADGARTAGCIDWYLVTTYYYPDGTTRTEEQYMYTTCGGCDPNQPQACPEELFPDGGGGDGGGIWYEYEAVKVQPWAIYTSPDSYNKLGATDWLYGTLAPNNGNKFTQIRNVDIDISNQFGSGHKTFASWYKYSCTTPISSNKKTGSTTVKGLIKWNNDIDRPDKNIDETKSWNADVDLY